MSRTELIALCVTGVMIVMDYLTGLAKAVHAKDLSSEQMREGLWHKSAYILVILLAEVIEHAQAWLDLGFDVPLVIPACVYIILTETASIIENIGQLNPSLAGGKLLGMFRTTNTGATVSSTADSGPRHKKEEP